MLRSITKGDVCKTWCLCRYNNILCTTGYYYSSVRYKSHYNTLGVDSKATPEEIKAAYYKLSFKFHPDKNDGSEASAAKFREVSEAYEVLGNAEKKEIYDRDRSSYTVPKYDDSRHGFNSQTLRKKHPHVYTGKSSYYDFDAHYREHYERYYEEKRARSEFRYRDMRRRPYVAAGSFKRFLFLWLVFIIFSSQLFNSNAYPDERKPIVYYNSSANRPSNDAKK